MSGSTKQPQPQNWSPTLNTSEPARIHHLRSPGTLSESECSRRPGDLVVISEWFLVVESIQTTIIYYNQGVMATLTNQLQSDGSDGYDFCLNCQRIRSTIRDVQFTPTAVGYIGTPKCSLPRRSHEIVFNHKERGCYLATQTKKMLVFVHQKQGCCSHLVMAVAFLLHRQETSPSADKPKGSQKPTGAWTPNSPAQRATKRLLELVVLALF